jgi:CRP-like cAMP-binding protein
MFFSPAPINHGLGEAKQAWNTVQVHAKTPEPAPSEPAAAPSWRAVLVKIPLFAGFTSAQLDRLAALTHERRMRSGEVLMRAGDPGMFMMIVSAGEVRVQLTGDAGQKQILATLGPGAVIGEIALFDGESRTADVVAATNGQLGVIERAAALRLLEQDPRFALAVITALCRRLRDTVGQLEALAFQDVAARLAACLLRLAGGSKPRRLDMTQEQVGQMIGASREIVNKRLRALAAAGLVRLTPGRIELLDEGLLAQVAEGSSGRPSDEFEPVHRATPPKRLNWPCY